MTRLCQREVSKRTCFVKEPLVLMATDARKPEAI
jgi:hypothetical protein